MCKLDEEDPYSFETNRAVIATIAISSVLLVVALMVVSYKYMGQKQVEREREREREREKRDIERDVSCCCFTLRCSNVSFRP